MRHAFSMLTAIFVIVIMASVAMFVITLSGKSVQVTTSQYQRAQAMLYAKSYTEYAILAVTGNDRSVDCVETINGTIGDFNGGTGYRIRTHIAYIVNGAEVDTSNCSGTRVLSTAVVTTQTPMSILVDAYVDYKEPDNTSITHTVHRRTIQKI